jgi:polyisoprenoid-binding protein YceI
MSTQAQATGTAVWNIDPSHSLVEFSARHMMITKVKGRFADVQGAITVDEADPARSGVQVEIAATSIDTRVEQRDAHLRSADFLDVENHPAITFRSTGMEGGFEQPGDRFRVHGDLTIRGVTRGVVLDATYGGEGVDPWGGTRVSFTAETKLDRREFGLQWNQALETGGVLVSNEIPLSLEIQAVRS